MWTILNLSKRGQAGNVSIREPRLAHSRTFIRPKKEQPVLNDWSTQHAAEIILPECSLLDAMVVCEPILGIEDLVAEVLECGTVKRVRAGLCDHRDLRSRRSAILWRKTRGLNAEFFQPVERHQVAGSSEGTRRWDLAGSRLGEIAGPRSQVCAHPV